MDGRKTDYINLARARRHPSSEPLFEFDVFAVWICRSWPFASTGQTFRYSHHQTPYDRRSALKLRPHPLRSKVPLLIQLLPFHLTFDKEGLRLSETLRFVGQYQDGNANQPPGFRLGPRRDVESQTPELVLLPPRGRVEQPPPLQPAILSF